MVNCLRGKKAQGVPGREAFEAPVLPICTKIVAHAITPLLGFGTAVHVPLSGEAPTFSLQRGLWYSEIAVGQPAWV